MPWKIEKEGNKYNVVRKTDGTVKSSFHDKEKALAYLKALYANEPEVIKKPRRK